MRPVAFRVQMYKSIIDSNRVDLVKLTVVVGKNESGKTTLRKALHKFKPFRPDPYAINREWPRGHRRSQKDDQTVCTVRFEFDDDEVAELGKLTDQKVKSRTVEVAKTYAGSYTAVRDEGQYPARPRRDAIEQVLADMPAAPEAAGEEFRAVADACRDEARHAALDGNHTALTDLAEGQTARLKSVVTADPQSPERQQEDPFAAAYPGKLKAIATRLRALPTIQQRVHEYVIDRIPTFVYMDEYRSFRGTAWLDQIQQKKRANQLDDEDRTLLMILSWPG